MTEAKVVAAFLMGLMSSAHCLGMCGGISIALGMGAEGNFFQKFSRLFAHNTGRIICYSLLGLAMGFLTETFISAFQVMALVLRVVAGLMLIAMGFYIAQWWMGLTILERAGQHLWKKIQPLMKPLMPVTGLSQALLLGLCWGLLPCGLVYSALIWSATAFEPTSYTAASNSMLLMAAFGFGTMPAMLASGFGGSQLKRLLQDRNLRSVVALWLCVFGVWTILHAFAHHHS